MQVVNVLLCINGLYHHAEGLVMPKLADLVPWSFWLSRLGMDQLSTSLIGFQWMLLLWVVVCAFSCSYLLS